MRTCRAVGPAVGGGGVPDGRAVAVRAPAVLLEALYGLVGAVGVAVGPVLLGLGRAAGVAQALLAALWRPLVLRAARQRVT